MRTLLSTIIFIASGISIAATSTLDRSEVHAGDADGSSDWAESRELVLIPELTMGVEDGDSTEMFGKVFDIDVDAQDNLYVVDLGFKNVRVFSRSGEYTRSIGRTGSGPGEFEGTPLGLDVDDHGNVVVVDRNRLNIFDTNGTPIATFPHGSAGAPARTVVFGPDETLFVTWFDVWTQHTIHRYSWTGETLGSFCDSYAAGREVDVREESSIAGGTLDIDGYGTILYAQTYPFELRLFETSGTLKQTVVGGRRELDEEVEFTPLGDGFRIFLPTTSRGAIFLPDGSILHSTLKRSHEDYHDVKCIIELFSASGELLASTVVDELLIMMSADSRGRVYGFAEEPFPQVRGYLIGTMGN